jgi:hypothetical protein
MKFRARRVLIVGTPESVAMLTDVLQDELEVVPAHSAHDGLEKLGTGGAFDYVVCCVDLHDARLFDFLDAACSTSDGSARIAYVHASAPQLSPQTTAAITDALEMLGVRTFVDFASLAADLGEAAAREAVRAAILGDPP